MLKNKIFKAYEFAKKKHDGQKRKYTNAPYFVHVKYVARMIEDMTGDVDMIVSALLHDTIEDTKTTYEELVTEFGIKVADLVIELTSDKDEVKQLGKPKYLANKMLSMSSDALTIKLADRAHNVAYLDKDCKTREHIIFVKRYKEETESIFKALIRDEEFTESQKYFINKINNDIEYLNIKHRW